MDLDLTCIESFLVVANNRHFGRAAQRLNVTSSGLSKRISRLEKQVNARLIERSPEGVADLTPAGARFAPHALRVLAEAAAAMAAAGPGVQVRLGVPGRLGEFPSRAQLHALARQLRERVPGAVLTCVGLPFSDLTDALLDRRVDVLWTASEADHPHLRSTPLGFFSRVGVVSAGHPLVQSASLPVGEFAQLPMVFNPQLPQRWMSVFYLGDVRPARDAHLVEIPARDAGAVMRPVARGLGTTVLPAPVAHRVGPQLRTVELTGAPAARFFGAVRRGERRAAVLALIEVLALATGTPAGPPKPAAAARVAVGRGAAGD